MPIIFLVAVLAVVLVAWVVRRRGVLHRASGCRWVKSHPRRSSGLREFRCETCGEIGYSAEDRGPANCLKGIRGGL